MKSFLSLAILVILTASSLSAQTRIRLGQSLQGQLDSGSLKLDDGSYYDLYRYDSPGNESIIVTLSSSDFDAYLMVGTFENNVFNDIDTDDDGGGGTDSRLEVTLSTSGTYYFRANTVAAEETGSYTIRLESASGSSGQRGSRATEIRDLKIGETITGRLTSMNEVLDDGSYAQRYRIGLAQGQIVQITLQGVDFDAFLTLLDEQGQRVAQDDDSGGGTDARIDHTATTTGNYIVLVNSLGENEEGDFTLYVEHKGGPRPGASAALNASSSGRRISVGQRVSGTLTSSSLKESDDSFYDAYLIQGIPNTTVSITLESDDFDAYLVIGTTDDGFQSLESDDDGGGGTNSQLIYRFTDSRLYEIRANTLSEGETGNYTLTVASSDAASTTPAATMRTVAIDSRTYGTLSDSSLLLDDDSYYEDFLITGVANTVVEISMLSSDFDSFLSFGRLEGGSFTSILSNDDCKTGSSNSCVQFTFPDNGSYVIRANTLSAGETGGFWVWVVKKGM